MLKARCSGQSLRGLAACCYTCRSLTTSAINWSGHNKWSKIRHKKSVLDASRGNLFSRLANDISLAAKSGSTTSTGGIDGAIAADNVRLAVAIAAAKRQDMPKANIEAAIKRGTGTSKEGLMLEHVTYEAMIGTVGLIIECLTDKRTRTVANVKTILKKYGANMAPSLFMFERKGQIVLCSPSGFDTVFGAALEAGAEEVEESTQGLTVEYEILTSATELGTVVEAVSKLGDVTKAELSYVPVADAALDLNSAPGELATNLRSLVDTLEDATDVVKVTVSTV